MKKILIVFSLILSPAWTSNVVHAGTWLTHNDQIFTILDDKPQSEELFKLWDYKYPEESNSRAMKEFRSIDRRVNFACVYYGETTCSAHIRLNELPSDSTIVEQARGYYGAIIKDTDAVQQASLLYDSLRLPIERVSDHQRPGVVLAMKRFHTDDEGFVIYCVQVENQDLKPIPGFHWCNIAIRAPKASGKKRTKN